MNLIKFLAFVCLFGVIFSADASFKDQHGRFVDVAAHRNGGYFINGKDVHLAGNYAGSCLNDKFGVIAGWHTWTYSGKKISIGLQQSYVINTIKFWLYDRDSRYFSLYIEVSADGSYWHKVYDKQSARGWQSVTFDPENVQQIRFHSRGGTYPYLHLFKVMAYYSI